MNGSANAKWTARRPAENPSSIQVDVSGFVTISLEVMTLFGNLFPAIAVFLCKKSRNRTVTDYFIGTLAVNDMLSVAVPLTLGIPTLTLGHWVGEKVGCQLYQVCIFWFQINAMFLVTSMSIERYIALKMPVYYRRAVLKKIHRVKILIATLFLASLVIACMPLMGLANDGIHIPLTYCPSILISKATKARERVYSFLVQVLGYSTLIVVFLCNFVVIKVMKDFNGKFQQRTLGNESTKERTSVVSFTKLVFVLGALFYLTWTPVMVLLTLNELDQRVNELTAVYALSSLTINSLLHPVVYGIFSVKFRQSYCKIVQALLPSFLRHKHWYRHRRQSHNDRRTSKLRTYGHFKREVSQGKN